MAARSGVRRAAGTVGGDAGSDPLQAARRAAADLRWLDVFEALSGCDRGAGLAAEDLELLATAAFLLGRAQECRQARLRAYQLYLHQGHIGRASRCAARIGLEQLGAGVLSFVVDDIDDSLEELRARGVRLLPYDDLGADGKGIVRHPDRDIAWFADPAGNIHSVARLKKPLPQRPA